MNRILVVTACCALVACAPKAPALVPPDHVESFCAEKEPRGTAIASILSSVADRVAPIRYPADAVLRRRVKSYGGVIGHWRSQPLYLPATARALGVPGKYVDVTEVVIDNELEPGNTRFIYVTVEGPHGPKHLVLRAYDTQNVCVEGTRLS